MFCIVCKYYTVGWRPTLVRYKCICMKILVYVNWRSTCTLVTASPKASVTECVHLCIIERSQWTQLLRERCLIMLTGQVPMFESRCAGNTQLHTLLHLMR